MPDTASYFPASTDTCPTFVGDTEWTPLVDGKSYFAVLDEALEGLGRGDSVQIAGLEVEAGLDLHGRSEGDPGYRPLGGRLAEIAAAGGEVRVLIAGKIPARSLPIASLAGFRGSVRSADRMRRWRPDGWSGRKGPLAKSVLLDWSGPLLGSNHQKVVVIDRDGELTAFVCGIDLTEDRYDGDPHDTLELDGERWGWHDCACRLRGPAANRVHAILAQRWAEASTLPLKMFPRKAPHRLFPPQPPVRLFPLNPRHPAPALAEAKPQAPVPTPDTSVRVMRSVPARKVDSVVPPRRRTWDTLPGTGLQEIHETLVQALDSAQRYVYLEDQYLEEFLGGDDDYELYPHLRAAARRGVKVVLVGSGVRDPEDPGLYLRQINSDLNDDLQEKVVDRLNGEQAANFAVHRVEHLTVHAKLVLVDDRFACIGSANMFSRSMGGTDSEISTAVETTTDLVRDLRKQVWAEHLRAPVTPELDKALDDLDLALGIWRTEWVPDGLPWSTWRQAGFPEGFAPTETVLRTVWPDPRAAR